jgi:hypothetical protein
MLSNTVLANHKIRSLGELRQIAGAVRVVYRSLNRFVRPHGLPLINNFSTVIQNPFQTKSEYGSWKAIIGSYSCTLGKHDVITSPTLRSMREATRSKSDFPETPL